MRIHLKLICGAAAIAALSGCVYPYGHRDHYGAYDTGYGGPYDSYYDGYYGPYGGGYWAADGYFYYSDDHHNYRRDEGHHFRHEHFEGANAVRSEHHGDSDRRDDHERGDRGDDSGH